MSPEYLLEKETKIMFPLPLVGAAALAGRMLTYKNNSQNNIEQKFPIRPQIIRKPYNFNSTAPINPFEVLFKGLNRQLSGIMRHKPNENFDEIAERFIPEGSTILTPKYPLNSERNCFGDLDGDSKDELIVSFRYADEIKTIVLKKEDNEWFKVAEVSNPGYDSIHYREVVDLTGEGNKQLIIATASQGKDTVLRGYALDNGILNEMFDLSYNRLQVIKEPLNNRSSSIAKLAVWKREENDTYNIELLQWDGSKLESINDNSTYYSQNVVPYYVKKVKREPDSPINWYNLADALAKAGSNRDALIASQAGMRYELSPELKEKFETLISMATKQ